MRYEKHLKILLLSLTFVGCAPMDRDDERLVREDLSFKDFKVYTNIEETKTEVEPSVFTPPFTNENLSGHDNDKSSWLTKLISWVPSGAYKANITKACHFSQVEKILSHPGITNQKQAEDFQGWVNKCEPQLSRYAGDKFTVLLNYALTKYSMRDNENLTKVKINLSNGYILRGILGLKRDGEKRPLILIQSGVHNNADDGPSARNIIMQLFDESPFNVLFIGSVTGKDFMMDNGMLTLGGLDEGRNLIEIARMIKNDAPFKDIVSEIHVLGISLGGHGALYSSLYNSFLKEKAIESVMAFCPVNNLGPTMDSVFDNTLRGVYYNMLTKKLFKEVYDYVPVLGQVLKKNENWSRETMRVAVKEMSFRHYRAISQYDEWTYPPFSEFKIRKPEDLWNLSQFVDQADKVSTPTMVAYSGDDYLVLPNLNSNTLLEKLKNSPNPNLGVVKFQKGNHCAAAISSGWPTISSLFRTYFLSHSKNVDGLNDTVQVNLKNYLRYKKYPLSKHLNKNNLQSNVEFQALKKKDYVHLKFTIFDPTKDRYCKIYKYNTAPRECFYKESVDVPIAAFHGVDVSSPVDEFESQRLTRWLNTHVEVLNAKGENLLGDREWPVYLKISGRYDY